MADEETRKEMLALRDEVARLDAVVAQLSERLARVERISAIESQPAASPEPAAAAPESGQSHHLLRRASIICFVLLGAQVLRYMTRSGLVPAELGLTLGLSYSGLLLIGPALVARWRGRLTHGTLLELCGGLLAPLVILEAVHRGGQLQIPAAALGLGCVGIAGAALGLLNRSIVTASATAVAAIVAEAALGLTHEAALLRAGVVVVLVAVALLLARRRDAPLLRLLTALPALLVLAAGVLLTGRRTGLPPHVAPGLLASVAGIWLLVTLDYALRRASLSRLDRSALYIATLLVVGLGAFLLPGATAAGAAALGLVALAAGTVGAARLPGEISADLTALGALLAMLGLTGIDPSGAALAALALALLRAARRPGAWTWTTVWSRLMGAMAAVVAMVHCSARLGGLPATTLDLIVAPAVAALVVLHAYLDAVRSAGDRGRWLTTLTFAAGLGQMCSAGLLVSARLFDGAADRLLARTVLLALCCAGLLLLGRRLGRRDVKVFSLLGIGGLAVKVLLWDMRQLEGLGLLAALSALALTALLASMLVRSGHPKGSPAPASNKEPKARSDEPRTIGK